MKVKNIIFVVCTIVTLLLVLNVNSYATINPDNFKPTETMTSEAKSITELGERITGAITVVGTVVAVVTTMILGIKYMMGSVEEKAEYKKSMMPMLIGMILVFGISWIIKLIYDIVSGINV